MSKIGSVDLSFLKNILDNLSDWQSKGAVLWDEVYITASITYHGRTLLGKAADDAQKLAKTIYGIMIKCLYDRPEFLCTVTPVSNLSSSFLIEQSRAILDIINGHHLGKVIVIFADGHRIN